ncbi:hypothetical protein HNY73_006230 [Argiope bruennichi]|uniref:Uncharacterized protein n=1 Tax=Argiope bruennichi TaxID=94029 RepID=A0A8T0FK77_ARGBR|nr:hypothetical protein HNY73_006230 [Argiope bruennichi]
MCDTSAYKIRSASVQDVIFCAEAPRARHKSHHGISPRDWSKILPNRERLVLPELPLYQEFLREEQEWMPLFDDSYYHTLCSVLWAKTNMRLNSDNETDVDQLQSHLISFSFILGTQKRSNQDYLTPNSFANALTVYTTTPPHPSKIH